jgi:hypothetical protein
MRMPRPFLLASIPLVFLVACGSDDNNTGNGNGLIGNTSPSPATSQQIDECKSSCDQQKFFSCYDAAAHSVCLQNCGKANTDQADQFIRCVKVETCDAECSVELTKPPPVTGNNGGGDCPAACNKLVTCGYLKGDQATECPSHCGNLTSEEAAALACINANSCADIPQKCGGEDIDGPAPTDDPSQAVAQCQSACSSLQIRSCIDATTATKCSTSCETASTSSAAAFNSCAFSAADCSGGAACYTGFSGQPAGTPPATIEACKQSCEDLGFFSCIEPVEQGDCTDRCDAAAEKDITKFNSCMQNAVPNCDQAVGCYGAFKP